MILATAIVFTIGTIDVNTFKVEIAKLISTKIQRDVHILGDLKLSIFPRLQLSTGKIQISNPKKFQSQNSVFMEVVNIDLSLQLFPLLTQQIIVNNFAIQGFKLNLITKSQANNWQDLIKIFTTDSNSKTNLPIFTCANLHIKNAEINWQNKPKSQNLSIKNLNFQAKNFKLQQYIPIKIKLELNNNSPKLFQQIEFLSNLNINPQLNLIQLQKTQLKLETQTPLLPKKISSKLFADITYNYKLATINFSHLVIEQTPINLTGKLNIVLDKPKINASIAIKKFDLAKMLQDWNIKLPKISNKILRQFSIKMDLFANSEQISINNLQSKLDQSTLTGKLKLNNFNQPAITFDLKLDQANLEHYLIANTKTPTIKDPIQTLLEQPNLLPLNLLKEFPVTGVISIKKIESNQANIKNVVIELAN